METPINVDATKDGCSAKNSGVVEHWGRQRGTSPDQPRQPKGPKKANAKRLPFFLEKRQLDFIDPKELPDLFYGHQSINEAFIEHLLEELKALLESFGGHPSPEETCPKIWDLYSIL